MLHYRYVTEVAKDGLHWIKQELRQTYCRRASSTRCRHTTKKYLAWVQYEAQQVADLIKFVRRRRADAPEGASTSTIGNGSTTRWRRVIKHRITFDMDQTTSFSKKPRSTFIALLSLVANALHHFSCCNQPSPRLLWNNLFTARPAGSLGADARVRPRACSDLLHVHECDAQFDRENFRLTSSAV